MYFHVVREACNGVNMGINFLGFHFLLFLIWIFFLFYFLSKKKIKWILWTWTEFLMNLKKRVSVSFFFYLDVLLSGETVQHVS